MTLASQADLFAAESPRPRTQTTRSGEEGKQRAFEQLQRAKKNHAYLEAARAVADRIEARLGYCTVDLVREELPPFPGTSLTIMGCVMMPPKWKVDDTAEPIFSKRGINNGKRIARFIRAEKAGPG